MLEIRWADDNLGLNAFETNGIYICRSGCKRRNIRKKNKKKENGQWKDEDMQATLGKT